MSNLDIGAIQTGGRDIGPIQSAAGSPTQPTLTGPNSATEATPSAITGTNLDTLSPSGDIRLITTTGGFSKALSYGTPTEPSVPDVDWETGQDEARDAAGFTAVPGIPLTPTISAAGITPWQQQVEVDNGTDPAVSRNITVSAENGLDVIQTMITVANTTAGESIFATTILTLEDNHQAVLPDNINGMNITLSADGTFTTDADQTENIDVLYFTPSTGQWKKVTLTISGSAIIGVGGAEQLTIGIRIGI